MCLKKAPHSRTVVVKYQYDAWGKEISHTPAGNSGSTLYAHNALKYRGYYYDAETGFYYVSSRYYDPEIGRFINADTIDLVLASQTTLTDKNLYAYCDNNPIIRKDDNGNMWIYAAIGGGVVGGVISALSYMSSLAVSGEQFDFGKFIGTTTVGVLNGILGGVAGVSSGFLKITLILASGGVSGIYTYRTTKGTHEYKLAAAVAAGTITTIGTYTGTLFDTNRLAKIDIAVANGVATFFTGVPTEMVNKVFQYDLAKAYTPSPASGVKKGRTSYSVNNRYPSPYICAVV